MRIILHIFIAILLLLPQQRLIAQSASAPKQYKVKVVRELPHSRNSYTQGLFFMNGVLYESAGQYGKSEFKLLSFDVSKSKDSASKSSDSSSNSKTHASSGKCTQSITLKETSLMKFPSKIFAEGAVELSGKIYILTWLEHKVFVLDAKSFKKTGEYYNKNEGWGLTTDGKSLFMSDGSAFIYNIDPNGFKIKSKVMVTFKGKPVKYLNELEMIDGKIWANVYTTDNIVIINPKNGFVEGVIDCKGLLKKELFKSGTDVLNGIAFNQSDRKIYLTGKNWPLIFQVELVEK